MKPSSWIVCLIFLSAGSVCAIASRQTGVDTWISRWMDGKAELRFTQTNVSSTKTQKSDNKTESERSILQEEGQEAFKTGMLPSEACTCAACLAGKSKECVGRKDQKINRFEERYWLGVQINEPSVEILSQLNIRCGQLVSYVIPDSPAADHFRTHDVIYQFNGKPVNCISTLGKLIQDNKGKVANIDVYRKCKSVRLKIKPKKITISRYSQPEQSDYVTPDDDSVAASLDFQELEPGDKKQYLVYMVRRPVVISKKTKKSNKVKERLNLESVVSFHRDKDGERYVIVHQGNRKEEYPEKDFYRLPGSVQKLIGFVEKLP